MEIKFMLEAQLSARISTTWTEVSQPIGIGNFDHYPSEEEMLQCAKEWLSDSSRKGYFKIDFLQVQKLYFVGDEL